MRFPLFGTSTQGQSPNVTAQGRINLYAEERPEQDKTQLAIYGTAGKVLFVSFGETPVRGARSVGTLLYVVHRGTLYSVNNAGVKTSLGSLLTTSGKVSMQDNGNIIQMVDGEYGYTFNISAQAAIPVSISTITHVSTLATVTTVMAHGMNNGIVITVSGASPAEYNGTFEITVTGDNTFTYTMLSNPASNASPVGAYVTVPFRQVTDEDFVPGFTNTWMNGYFIKDRRGSTNPVEWGRFDISTDGYTYDGLDFANAESNPDYLEAVFTDHGEVILFGTYTTEFWTNSGAADFPLSYQGSATIEWGLAAKYSVSKFRDSVIFLARNRMGEVQVVMLNGYAPQIVSGNDVSYQINRYAAVEDATGFAYILNNHPFYQINFPTANKSWLYDGLSNTWNELQSGSGRDVGDIGVNYLNRYLVTDHQNGNIYFLDGTVYTENGMSIKRQLVGRHVFDEEYLGTGRIILDMQPGVGIQVGQGSDPQVILEVSKDGGHTWGQELWRSCGAVGEYKKRVLWNRIGVARDTVFRFTITDPIKVVILGAWLDLS